MTATIASQRQGGVLTLVIQRPPVNALDVQSVADLLAEIKSATGDAAVRCIVITGSQGVFCAGHDLNEMLTVQGQSVSYRQHLQETYNPLILAIRQVEKPVLAAVNGPVAGAGLGIALACDLRLASSDARFTVGFSGIGLVPDSGVSLFLPLLIGMGRATELAFTNTSLEAGQALEWGLVNRLVAADALSQVTAMIAGGLATGPVGAYGLTKRAFNQALLNHLAQTLEDEGELQELASHSAEHREGVAAFLQKRLPKFI